MWFFKSLFQLSLWGENVFFFGKDLWVLVIFDFFFFFFVILVGFLDYIVANLDT